MSAELLAAKLTDAEADIAEATAALDDWMLDEPVDSDMWEAWNAHANVLRAKRDCLAAHAAEHRLLVSRAVGVGAQ